MMQEWFKKAKLGIFIHWGIYAVKGVAESWSFGMGDLSYDEYMEQLQGFTASDYDPGAWARLFKEAGATYAVLTSKHHDGVALFDTKYTDLNVVKRCPAGRDLVAPYCDALRQEGLKVGIYFTNTDWSDPDHFSVVLDSTPEELWKLHKEKVSYRDRWSKVRDREAACGEEDIVTKPEYEKAWQRFLTRYRGEIRELLTGYGEVDLLFFDVMLTRRGYSWEAEKTRDMIRKLSPRTVINSRLEGYGDYETPEQYIPIAPLDGPWELCATLTDAWGFRYENRYKDVGQIVRMLCECISKGGNLLLSIGPDAAGRIPEETQKLLRQLGRWTGKYQEAIYPTEKGIGPEYFCGGTTLTEDKKTLYLFVYDRPAQRIMLNGVRTGIRKITSLASGAELSWRVIGGASWINMPGSIWIDVEEKDLDEVCTVLKVELADVIDLAEVRKKIHSGGEM